MHLSCFCLAAGLLHAVRCSVLSMDVETLNRIVRAVSAADSEWHGVLSLEVRVNRDGMDKSVASMLNDDLQVSGDMVRAQQVVSYLATHADSTTDRQIRYGVDVLGKAMSCQFTYTFMIHSYIAYQHSSLQLFNESQLRFHMFKIRMALIGYIDKLTFFNQDTADYFQLNWMINDVLVAINDQPPDAQINAIIDIFKQLQTLTMEWAGASCGLTEKKAIVNLVKLKDFDLRIFTSKWKEVDENCVTTMINNFDPYEFITFTNNSPEFWMTSLKIPEYEFGNELPDENSET